MMPRVERNNVHEQPPVPGLVRCRYADGCGNCQKDTVWRASNLDLHVCSAECCEELHIRDGRAMVSFDDPPR